MLVLDSKKHEIVIKMQFWFWTILKLIKSRTIVYGFALASIGTFLITTGFHLPDFFVLGRLATSVYFLALATYLYNDLTDYEVDKINKRDNAYSSQKTQYNQILYATIGFFAASILMAFSINFATGMGSLFFLGLAIAYSHPKINLKSIFVVKTLVTAAGGVIASMMGSLAANNLSYIGIASSLIVFLIYFINGPLNDIRDIEGDKKGGRRTIPIVIGIKTSFSLITVSVLAISAILLICNYIFGIHIIGTIAGLAMCAYLIIKIKKLSTEYTKIKKMNQTRTTVRNSIFVIQSSILLGMILSHVLYPNSLVFLS